jgi:hypothetical protein
MHFCVGIAHAGVCTFEMANTLAMIGYYQGKAGNEFNILGAESCLTDDNANNIIETARNMKADWLLLLDTDVEYLGKEDVSGKMLALNKDVLAGIYYQGMFPYRPVLYEFTKDRQIKNYINMPEKPSRVGAAGAGFLLIKKKVLDLFTPECAVKMGKPFDPIMKGKQVHLRADAAFFWRLKELGVELWADCSIDLAHIKKHKITKEFFNQSKKIFNENINA